MRSMKSYFAIAAVVIGLFVTGAVAQSSIDNQVYHKIRGLNYYNTFDYITWQANGSTVTLSGKTITLGTQNEAERAVKDIPGVTRVVNNIQELPMSSFDDSIRRAALVRFTNGGPGQYFAERNPDVHIIVENGRITLEGFVARKGDSDTLNVLANSISGVFGVTNNLVVGQRPRY